VSVLVLARHHHLIIIILQEEEEEEEAKTASALLNIYIYMYNCSTRQSLPLLLKRDEMVVVRLHDRRRINNRRL